MILEALLPCPHCGTRNATPAIAPFVWWYLLVGVKCYDCGARFPVNEYRKRPDA